MKDTKSMKRMKKGPEQPVSRSGCSLQDLHALHGESFGFGGCWCLSERTGRSPKREAGTMKDTKSMKKGLEQTVSRSGCSLQDLHALHGESFGFGGADVLGISVRERGGRRSEKQEP